MNILLQTLPCALLTDVATFKASPGATYINTYFINFAYGLETSCEEGAKMFKLQAASLSPGTLVHWWNTEWVSYFNPMEVDLQHWGGDLFMA